MRGGALHPAFAFHHRQTVNGTHVARVLIERVLTRGEFNVVTGQVEGATTQEIYLGRARIQKVAFPTNRDFVEDAAKFQRMRVAIGFSENELPSGAGFNVEVNDRIKVLVNGADPEKVGDTYYVHGDESSSNAWERVLTAQKNMKQG
jgi:hypothetical protein